MGGFYLQSLVCPKRIQLSEDKEVNLKNFCVCTFLKQIS